MHVQCFNLCFPNCIGVSAVSKLSYLMFSYVSNLSLKFENQFETINHRTMAAAGANAAAATAASAAAVFTELCTRFQLDDAVKDHHSNRCEHPLRIPPLCDPIQ